MKIKVSFSEREKNPLIENITYTTDSEIPLTVKRHIAGEQKAEFENYYKTNMPGENSNRKKPITDSDPTVQKILNDNNLHLRHIVPASEIKNYWCNNLKFMPLEKANKEVKEKLGVLNAAAIKIGYRPGKEWQNPASDNIEDQKTALEENIGNLIYLELVNHENLFYGGKSSNEWSAPDLMDTSVVFK